MLPTIRPVLSPAAAAAALPPPPPPPTGVALPRSSALTLVGCALVTTRSSDGFDDAVAAAEGVVVAVESPLLVATGDAEGELVSEAEGEVDPEA